MLVRHPLATAMQPELPELRFEGESCLSGTSAARYAEPQSCTPHTCCLKDSTTLAILLPCTIQSCRDCALCLRIGCYLQVPIQTLTAAAPAAVMETAGGTMLTWKNSILVCGGMDSVRKEHNNVWKWDLAGDSGFRLCHTTG